MLKRILVYSILMLALLCLVYPPRPEFALEGGPLGSWLGVYAGMALIMTAIGAFFSVVSDRLLRRTWLKSLTAALLTLAALAFYALTLGNVTAQTLDALPLEPLHGTFFRDFRSIKFAFVVAPCAAVLTLLLTNLESRVRSR